MALLTEKSAPFRELFNRKLAFTAFILALSQFNFGFEGAAFNNIQAMHHFIKDFGTKQPSGEYIIESTWLSLFNGCSIIGFAVGT